MSRNWLVLHVKPRTEKKVMAWLALYKYPRYLPTYTKVRKVQRRKVRTELPLFPGYVFTRLNTDERVAMLRTNLIVHTIPVPRPREVVHQLRQISRASRLTPALMPTAVFKAGDRVRVVSGPFRGVEGHVRREGAKSSIVLNVDILGQAVETSISMVDCEPFGDESKDS
jgi:transcription antitermination factor NusG